MLTKILRRLSTLSVATLGSILLLSITLVPNCIAQDTPSGVVDLNFTGEPNGKDSTDIQSSGSMRPYVVVEASLTNIYESNINHDDDDIDSRGLVPGGTLKIQNRKSKPSLVLEYRIASHQYTNTTRWNRVSNFAALTFAPKLTDYLYTESQAEISLKGSSEDRDLSDQYQVRQTIEYRLTKPIRIHLYGTLRSKVYTDPIDNAFKPNAGTILEFKLPGNREIEIEARHELNIEKEERGRYDRQTVEFKYERPAIVKNSELELKLKKRWKNYDRLIEVEQGGEDFEVPRRDQKTTVGAELSFEVFRKVGFTIEYEYEWRSSNDIDKLYNAHAAGGSLTVAI